MNVRPFPALTPAPGWADRVSSVPYDVVTVREARLMAAGNPHSFLRVVRADLEFPEDADPYGDGVYAKAKENFEKLQADGLLVREPEPCLYLYRQIMGDHVQTGVGAVCHIDDYANNAIRRHETTRPVKENDRTRLIDTLNAQPGPVFLAYRDESVIDAFVEDWISKHDPAADFVDGAAVRHVVWRVPGREAGPVLEAFEKVPMSYVADGHHRCASAYRVGCERQRSNPRHDGSESYNWFLATLFPASQLKILPYNRLVRDLNGLSLDEFLARAASVFDVCPSREKAPSSPGTVCVYLMGQWHKLSWPSVESSSPVECLDVSVLQDLLLGPVLGVGDPRTDERIGFVGGIRGPDELEVLVEREGWQIGFSMYPVTIDSLIAIADAGEMMPPKSTWFEPKLRSGLFVHTLD